MRSIFIRAKMVRKDRPHVPLDLAWSVCREFISVA